MNVYHKTHQRQVQKTCRQDDRKTQEIHALYKIGTEILALPSLQEILQLVVNKAREVTKCNCAVVCLKEPEMGLRVGARSIDSDVHLLKMKSPGEPVGRRQCMKVTQPHSFCPVTQEILPTHIALPMRSEGRVAGNLCVGYCTAHAMDKEALEFLRGLANLAAIAIYNARLHEKIHHFAVLEERERIAVDLHDGIIQSIYGTGLGLLECVQLADTDPEEFKRRMVRTIEELNVVIRDIRNYIAGLQCESLQRAKLSQSLADLIGKITANNPIQAKLKVEPALDTVLTREQTGQLFQICQESLANVVKHAGASTVTLTLGRLNNVVHLGVEDDGVGFDPVRLDHTCRGFRNLKRRVRHLDGALGVATAPGRGTTITVEFPLKAAV